MDWGSPMFSVIHPTTTQEEKGHTEGWGRTYKENPDDLIFNWSTDPRYTPQQWLAEHISESCLTAYRIQFAILF